MIESIDEREKVIKDILEQNTMLARNQLLLQQDFNECLDMVLEVVYQACADHPYGVQDCLDSRAIRPYADALHYLAKHGKVKITRESGRRVFAVVEKEVKE